VRNVFYENIHIIGTAIYHPRTKVNNEYFTEHFDKLGIEIRGLLKHLDRCERYLISSDEEDVISMSVKACTKVLDKTGLSPEEIDMIVFVSDNPQYTTPSNALIIHNKLGLKRANVVFDLNNNCVGMVTAIDFVSSYMRGNSNIRNAMIVGAQMVSRFARENDPITYATSGDGSAAVILQTSKEKSISGYLGAVYRADSKLSDKMRFPACGMSRILDEKIQSDDKKMLFIPHDVSYFADEWKELIIRLLNKNTLKPGEV
jgi:3-oxoacyl-[acyl-carrier-protein] synthase-3